MRARTIGIFFGALIGLAIALAMYLCEGLR
jgi:hypothetical protein